MTQLRWIGTVGIVLGWALAPVVAQQETADGAQPPEYATIEKIMDNAVKGIARRYSLNEAQTKYTEELMRREVQRFLRENYDEVWPAVRDLLSAGLRAPQNGDDAARVGKAALPLALKARKAIIDGNMEWRKILTPEQQAVHDYDLAAMEKTLDQIEENFKSWVDGKPTTGPLIPPGPDPKFGPRPPKQPPPGLPQPQSEFADALAMFDKYVEEFIKDYELDAGQIESARSILKEHRDKAQAHLDRNKAELEKIREGMQQAHEAKDRDKRNELETQHQALLEPVNELFTQMDGRLKALLTTAQIQRHEERQKSQEKAPAPSEPADSKSPAGAP